MRPHSDMFSVDDSWQETTAKDEEESNLVSETGSANSFCWNIFCRCLRGKSKKDKDPKNDSKDVEKDNIPEQEIRNWQQKRNMEKMWHDSGQWYVCKEPQEPQEPDKTDFEDKDAQFDVQMQPQGCDSKTFSHEFALEMGRHQ